MGASDIPVAYRNACRQRSETHAGFVPRSTVEPPSRAAPAWWSELGARFVCPATAGADGDELLHVERPAAWIVRGGKRRGVAVLVDGERREVEFAEPPHPLSTLDHAAVAGDKLLVNDERNAYEIDLVTARAVRWHECNQGETFYATCGAAEGRRAILVDETLILLERHGKEYVRLGRAATGIPGFLLLPALGGQVVVVHGGGVAALVVTGRVHNVGAFPDLTVHGEKDGEILGEAHGAMFAVTGLPELVAAFAAKDVPAATTAQPHLYAIDWVPERPLPSRSIIPCARDGAAVESLVCERTRNDFNWKFDRLLVKLGDTTKELHVRGMEFVGQVQLFPGGRMALLADADDRRLVTLDLSTGEVEDVWKPKAADERIKRIATAGPDGAIVVSAEPLETPILTHLVRTDGAWCVVGSVKVHRETVTVAATPVAAIVVFYGVGSKEHVFGVDAYVLGKKPKKLVRFDEKFSTAAERNGELLCVREWAKDTAWVVRGLPAPAPARAKKPRAPRRSSPSKE